MLLRKQTAYDQTFGTMMAFSPSKPGYEAGLVLWWNQYAFATIGITLVEQSGGDRVQTVVSRTPTSQAGVFKVSRRRKPSIFAYSHAHHASQTEYPLLLAHEAPSGVEQHHLTQGLVELTLRCSGATYELELRKGISKASRTCRAEDLTVMPPVGGAFAGVMFGLYSFGKGEPVLDPADFTGIKVMNRSIETVRV